MNIHDCTHLIVNFEISYYSRYSFVFNNAFLIFLIRKLENNEFMISPYSLKCWQLRNLVSNCFCYHRFKSAQCKDSEMPGLPWLSSAGSSSQRFLSRSPVQISFVNFAERSHTLPGCSFGSLQVFLWKIDLSFVRC